MGGHLVHDGPIFNAADSVAGWGDNIGPFATGDLASQGLDGRGQAILENGCEVPVGTVAVNKTIVDADHLASREPGLLVEPDLALDDIAILENTVGVTAGRTSDAFTDIQGGAHCNAVANTEGIANLVSSTSDGPVTVVRDRT